MIIIQKDNKNNIVIELNKDELRMLHAALNETCNGLDIFEFETRVSFQKQDLLLLLEKTSNFINSQ